MNNSYYPNNMFQNANQNPTIIPEQGTTPNQNIGMIVPPNINYNNNHAEYADNIFLLNIGRRVSVYFSYPDSLEWRDKIFTGDIVDAGRDYLLLRDIDGNSILLWSIYINYAIFEGDIVHNYN